MPYGKDMDSRDEIRRYLKGARKQNRAAAAIGVSRQHLSAWLQGRDGLSLPKMLALVDHLRTAHRVKVNLEALARDAARPQA